MTRNAAEKKWGFVVNATITLGVEVVAKTLKEAIEKAQSADVKTLCHQCASSHPGEWGTSGELDCGEPSDCVLVGAIDGNGRSVEGKAFDELQKKWKGEN